jgi:hypothetical protein
VFELAAEAPQKSAVLLRRYPSEQRIVTLQIEDLGPPSSCRWQLPAQPAYRRGPKQVLPKPDRRR